MDFLSQYPIEVYSWVDEYVGSVVSAKPQNETINLQESALQSSLPLPNVCAVLDSKQTRVFDLIEQAAAIVKENESLREETLKKIREFFGDESLSILVPICANCHAIRTPEEIWYTLEAYLRERTRAKLYREICPDCAKKIHQETPISVELSANQSECFYPDLGFPVNLDESKILDLLEQAAEVVEKNKSLRKVVIQKLKGLFGDESFSTLVPMCSECHAIRTSEGWHKLEIYVRDNTRAELSHGLCPDCAKELYPDILLYPTDAEVKK